MAGNKNSGRPRKPTAQHKLHGTYREDRHGEREDDLFTGTPTKPRGLKGEAAKLWKLIYPHLVNSGIAKEPDAPAIEAMCRWWALWQTKMIELETGATEDEAKDSIIASRYFLNFRTLAAKFGLTPADRERFTKSANSKKDSPTDKFGIVG